MMTFHGTYTDQYQLTMAQVYFLTGQQTNWAVFDYFYRQCPFGGGYAVFAGLEDVLACLENLRFDEEDITFLRQQGMHPDFLAYLRHFRFRGSVYACREGEIIFPNTPVVVIEAPIIEAQIIETLLLNLLNFQSLIATKAKRIRTVAPDQTLIEFGLRRAQGPGGYYASRAAIVGGFDATSNVLAGRDHHIPLMGTMSHAFVQNAEDELSAFEAFVEVWPEDSVLLVDTYSTLNSGIPNAIHVAKEMEKKGQRLKGVRLDSGDLCLLAKKAREMLDEAGLFAVKIIASSQLDEYSIKTLLEAHAPIDAFGVGTSLTTGHPDGALDGVYKLAFSQGKPRLKLSDTKEKMTLPHKKQVYRLFTEQNTFAGVDVVALAQEKKVDVMCTRFDIDQTVSIQSYGKKPLLEKVMQTGKRLHQPKSLTEIANYCQNQFLLLPDVFKVFEKASIYQVGLSIPLKQAQNELIQKYTHSNWVFGEKQTNEPRECT